WTVRLRDRARRTGSGHRLPRLRERHLRARRRRHLRNAGSHRSGRISRGPRDRAAHGGGRDPDPARARFARPRSATGIARMIVLILAVPLGAAALLTLTAPRAAIVVHTLAALFTLAIGLTLTAGAVGGLKVVSVGEVVRDS